MLSTSFVPGMATSSTCGPAGMRDFLQCGWPDVRCGCATEGSMLSSQPAAASHGAQVASAASAAFAAAERALAEDATSEISDAAVQQLLTAGTRLFARKIERERRYFSPLTAGNAVTPTDAAVMVTELLQAVNLNLF